MPFRPDTVTQFVAGIDALPLILDVVGQVTGMGFAAVTYVSGERWIVCRATDDAGFGIADGMELYLDPHSSDAEDVRRPIIMEQIEHGETRHRPEFCGAESYISYPIILPDGRFFGTLCAMDRQPRILRTTTVQGAFSLFTELIAFHLSERDKLAAAEDSLRQQQEINAFREQFIAILGHDLRNPLASLSAGMRMLRRNLPADKTAELMALMEGSVVRMSRMLDDVTDFTRSRLGEGMILDPQPVQIDVVMMQTLEELRLAHPERSFDVDVEHATVTCDARRMGQLLSNLLANAILHGDIATPIGLVGSRESETYRISVTNGGDPISDILMAQIFEPFFRRHRNSSREGFGLGLYIAREIARAHGSDIEVDSKAGTTSFSVQLPL
ncbi:histidine kinase [Haematobacter missouriensis]|uniref:histidine kinase n=1 Tax=Haematobacter missouriensis TaxID=366616 RepID=A0A212AY75_9RHOB|nr:HAMP domain-containing sensor histidine kinase [Haematobacter missouriensis]KFI27293.1 histidine kinase [Haematobacter missouriensis]OWJ77538.1 sensor histidine kinase [Haematobacter missouriensis]OWJ86437.1 sensor histidine kinase [Haematobacter missouriensis]